MENVSRGKVEYCGEGLEEGMGEVVGLGGRYGRLAGRGQGGQTCKNGAFLGGCEHAVRALGAFDDMWRLSGDSGKNPRIWSG